VSKSLQICTRKPAIANGRDRASADALSYVNLNDFEVFRM